MVTGGSGLFAINAVNLLKGSNDVVCVGRNPVLKVPNVSYELCDLADKVRTERLLEQVCPDIIINTAGMTSVEDCELNYFSAYTSNVLVAKNLAQYTATRKAKLVHISTDHFSDSNIFRASENQIEIPRNNYASTKLEAERLVAVFDKNALIIRTNFFGWGHPGRQSFSDYIINNLSDGNEISLFDDVLYSPIYIDELVRSLFLLCEKECGGVFNICSTEAITKYSFGKKLAKVFNLDQSLIKEGSLESRKDLVSRPIDMSLSNEKFLSEVGMAKGPSIDEMLDNLHSAKCLKEEYRSLYRSEKATLNYGKHHIDDSDIDRVINIVSHKNLTQGDEVDFFEDEIKKFTGAKYAVAVSNWTNGLHLSCLALGIGPGDKVITTPNTFVASANCVKYVGGEVILCDIDKETLNLCPKKLEKICEQHPDIKAVIPVHFAGLPCDMEKISKLSKKYNFSIIEDAAHALGGRYSCGEKVGVGKYSDLIGFSFHPVKNIACGEGGCIVTDNEDLYKKLLRLRSHGIAKADNEIVNREIAFEGKDRNPWYYEMQELGYNYRITDIQCGLGVSQIQRLPFFMEKRASLAREYESLIIDNDLIKVPQRGQREKSGNHLFVILINFEKAKISKNQFYKKMSNLGVNCHVHYIPVHFQPYYSELREDNLTVSNEVYFSSVTLPLHVGLTTEDLKYVVSSINGCLSL